VGRFASLGDAAPAMSDEKQEGARKGKRTEKEAALVAADTLRAMGATSQPYQTKPPSAQLGGVRKVGSETFLDDFTNSFEDDLRRELDDAAEEGRTREAAKKLKKEKAAKKEKAKAKKAKAKAAKAKKSEEKLAADTLETETLEAEKTQASHTEGRGETASASLGKAFSKQKRGSKESTKKHGTRFDDDDDDETTHVRSGVKTVSIDDLFQAIGDGDLGDASGDGTGTGTGDDLFQDGDASGDDDSAGDETRRGSSGGAGISWKNDRGFDDTPSKNGGEFVTKLGGHGGRKHSAKTVSDSDETSLFLKAMSKKGVSRDDSSAAASQIATSFRDKNTKISITSSDGHENHFTIGDLGFDDLPGIDDQAVRMYVEGGREYFSELYEKGADWVNERYETTVNATSLWVDEYAESGRSKKRVTVDVFVDVSDPYSLELMLGPIQNLLKMDLGPLQWRFHARVNAGQGLRKRVNCGGEIAGSPARTSCVANAAVQCSQRTFQNMTSGLGRFEKRAEEIKQRRAQVERAKAALGMDGNFRKLSKNSFEDEEHKNFGSGFWNLPGTKKQSVESVVSLPEHPVRQVRERLVGRDFSARRRSASNSGVVGTRRRRALAANPDAQPDDGDLSVEVDSVDSDEFVSSEATRTSNDYVPDQDTFVDLFEPDDSVAPEYADDTGTGVDVDEYDLPIPTFLDARTEAEIAAAPRADDTITPINVFLTCFSGKLLDLESQVAGVDSIDSSSQGSGSDTLGKDATLLRFSEECCSAAIETGAKTREEESANLSSSSSQESLQNSFLMTCKEQASCLRSGTGFRELGKASDLLDSLKPKPKWLPWVLVEKKPVCVRSCNLQQGIRRAVCNNREGTLPLDCPRFPWAKIWYDEPGISAAGVVGVVLGLALTTGSMVLLAQQAGCCGGRKKKEEEKSASIAGDETAPLLAKE